MSCVKRTTVLWICDGCKKEVADAEGVAWRFNPDKTSQMFRGKPMPLVEAGHIGKVSVVAALGLDLCPACTMTLLKNSVTILTAMMVELLPDVEPQPSRAIQIPDETETQAVTTPDLDHEQVMHRAFEIHHRSHDFGEAHPTIKKAHRWQRSVISPIGSRLDGYGCCDCIEQAHAFVEQEMRHLRQQGL